MKKKFTCLLILIIGIFTTANADIITPCHSCSKPYKPYEFSSQYEIDNFRNEVEAYKRCLNDFIDEQNEAIRMHQNAAQEAIDDWNNFVNYELN